MCNVCNVSGKCSRSMKCNIQCMCVLNLWHEWHMVTPTIAFYVYYCLALVASAVVYTKYYLIFWSVTKPEFMAHPIYFSCHWQHIQNYFCTSHIYISIQHPIYIQYNISYISNVISNVLGGFISFVKLISRKREEL